MCVVVMGAKCLCVGLSMCSRMSLCECGANISYNIAHQRRSVVNTYDNRATMSIIFDKGKCQVQEIQKRTLVKDLL